MQCPGCGTENAEDAIVCVACREVIDAELADAFDDDTDAGIQSPPSFGAAPVPSDDDWAVSSHTRAQLMGAVRDATSGELARGDCMLRADAVLTLTDVADVGSLSPFEQHIASHLDGVRTVARVRKKTGLSGDDVRIALGMMRDKNMLRLVGLFDPSLAHPGIATVPAEAAAAEAPKPTAAPIPEAFEMPDSVTLPGVDLTGMETEHGPASEARTDPAVSRAVLDELRNAVGDDDDDDDDGPSPFGG